jgi:hypothetical protein
MTRTVTVKGRVVGPQTVELDEPLPSDAHDVEVVARIDVPGRPRRISEILRSFPPGARTREAIDRECR